MANLENKFPACFDFRQVAKHAMIRGGSNVSLMIYRDNIDDDANFTGQ